MGPPRFRCATLIFCVRYQHTLNLSKISYSLTDDMLASSVTYTPGKEIEKCLKLLDLWVVYLEAMMFNLTK
ncbi:hypothetical protein LINPERHAP2_LOCUS10861 [Linum perenne]